MWAAILLLLLQGAAGEILTPPYLNLALGKKITATATCGDIGQELYCELTGSTDETVIQGQVCEYCDETVENRRHPPEYAVDGLETRWQSPPLSRGMKYNEVNLTIDLGQGTEDYPELLNKEKKPRKKRRRACRNLTLTQNLDSETDTQDFSPSDGSDFAPDSASRFSDDSMQFTIT